MKRAREEQRHARAHATTYIDIEYMCVPVGLSSLVGHHDLGLLVSMGVVVEGDLHGDRLVDAMPTIAVTMHGGVHVHAGHVCSSIRKICA